MASNFRFGMRLEKALGGSRSCRGGALEDLPNLVDRIHFVTYFNDFIGAASYDAANDFSLTEITSGSAAHLADDLGVPSSRPMRMACRSTM